MKQNPIFIIIIASAIVFLVIGTGYFLSSSQSLPAEPPEPLTISLPVSESSALVYIAQDQHYFTKNGLALTVKNYEPPAAGVRGMLNGEVDLSGASEYAVVLNALREEPVSILVRADEVQSVYILGLKGRGIANTTDLRGKKIGVARGTNGEFFLGRFLTLHGMSMSDVTPVDVQPARFVSAIGAGETDAIICWEPYASDIRGRMGDQLVVWPAQGGQPTYGVIIVRNDWIARHPELAERFLRSLDAAEKYLTTHPAESRAIVKRHTNFSEAYMAVLWPENHFSLSLDQSLVLAMEDEARWMIANNMTNATAVPDFGNYIYTEGLDSVKPGSVNIIR